MLVYTIARVFHRHDMDLEHVSDEDKQVHGQTNILSISMEEDEHFAAPLLVGHEEAGDRQSVVIVLLQLHIFKFLCHRLLHLSLRSGCFWRLVFLVRCYRWSGVFLFPGH